jgi:hypothetical protein
VDWYIPRPDQPSIPGWRIPSGVDRKAAYTESKHPRKPDGEFAPKSTGGPGAKAPRPKKTRKPQARPKKATPDVAQALQDMLARLPQPALKLNRVPPERFHAAFQKAHNDPVHGKFLTPYSPEDFAKMETYLNADGTVGGAVKTADDGVREGVSLFNQGGPKGSGRKLLREMVDQHSVKRLDAIGPGLQKVYESVGFEVTERIPWDDQYAPEGWDYERFGRPDIVVMEVPDP